MYLNRNYTKNSGFSAAVFTESPSKHPRDSSNQPQTTQPSDFMNRFKGKISTMNKDGHLGIVQRTNQPINKMDFIGFKSGMSDLSSFTGAAP